MEDKLINKQTKPAYLYHGSPKLLTILEPRTARGVGVGKHKLHGIYANINYPLDPRRRQIRQNLLNRLRHR